MADLSPIQNGEHLTLRRQLSLTAQLALPAILAQMSSILMQYIDASMVGRIGEDGAASVGLMSSSLWLFWGICSAVTTGFSVQVAHRLGGKEPDQARRVIRQGITSVLVVSTVMMLIGLLIARPLPYWLGGDEAISPNSGLYFAVFVGALPILTLSYLAGGVLRAAGNMKIPTILNISMCVIDVLLNWFLIFPTRPLEVLGHNIVMPGAGLGVLGAALGTVGAEIIVAAFLMWYMLCRQPDTRIKGRPHESFRPTAPVMRRAFKISMPMALEHAIFCFAQVTITVIVAPLGNVAIAANAFAVTAESLCYMPGFGIGDAATTLVGQSLGAGRRDLIKRFCHLTVGLGIVVMTLMGVILYMCAPMMMHIMTDVEAIASLGTKVLRIEAFAEPLYAASIVAYGAFVGVGDTTLPAIMNFGSIWAVRIPLAALLAGTMGLPGVWIAMAIELSFRGIIFLWRMFSDKWLPKTSDATPAVNASADFN